MKSKDKRHLAPNKLIQLCQFLSQDCPVSNVASRTGVAPNSVKNVSAKLLQLYSDALQEATAAGSGTEGTGTDAADGRQITLQEFVLQLGKMHDDAIEQMFYPKLSPAASGKSDAVVNGKYYPDFQLLASVKAVEKRMSVKEIFEGYLSVCAEKNAAPLSQTHFYKCLGEEIEKINAENRNYDYYFIQDFKYGEFAQIDFSGTRYPLMTVSSHYDCWILVISFPASYYTFATFVTSQSTEESCRGITDFVVHLDYHIPSTLVCDNFRGAVIMHKGSSIVFNNNFQRFMRELGLAINPCPVRKPQDKSCVEFSVGLIEKTLREDTVFRNELMTPKPFAEHCRNLQNLVDAKINNGPFRKSCTITRKYLFDTYEFCRLRQIKSVPQYSELTENIPVPRSYHVLINNRLYSVPYTCTGKTVSAKLTNDLVILYHRGVEVARHLRNDGTGFSAVNILKTTNPEHMPPKHRQIENDNARFSKPEDILNTAKEYDGENGGLSVFCRKRLEYADRDPSQYLGNAMSSCKSIIRMWEKKPFKELVSRACMDVITQNSPRLWNKLAVENRYKLLLSQASSAARNASVSAGKNGAAGVGTDIPPAQTGMEEIPLSEFSDIPVNPESFSERDFLTGLNAATSGQINYANHDEAWFTGTARSVN